MKNNKGLTGPTGGCTVKEKLVRQPYTLIARIESVEASINWWHTLESTFDGVVMRMGQRRRRKNKEEEEEGDGEGDKEEDDNGKLWTSWLGQTPSRFVTLKVVGMEVELCPKSGEEALTEMDDDDEEPNEKVGKNRKTAKAMASWVSWFIRFVQVEFSRVEITIDDHLETATLAVPRIELRGTDNGNLACVEGFMAGSQLFCCTSECVGGPIEGFDSDRCVFRYGEGHQPHLFCSEGSCACIQFFPVRGAFVLSGRKIVRMATCWQGIEVSLGSEQVAKMLEL
eukprot:TRINITY_DN2219_c2_g1_i1.p1 TRINITY_DN2219_c2_g1~~TRINITY_DN2219_c2_g1_i1.p1  ORF type:complete len:283 (-),score=59.77 TRINITY_DN2219_c2_g1_i1:610-1458(-)